MENKRNMGFGDTNENIMNVPAAASSLDADSDLKVDLSAGGLELDLSGLTGFLYVEGGTGYALSAVNARASLGLGSIATQNANSVNISGGVISGITDLAVADGGTGASNAAGARTNLGLVIGTNIQAHGDVLDDFNTLGAAGSDGQFIVATGAGAFAYESGATARTSLGLGTGDAPEFSGAKFSATTYFSSEVDNGNSGNADTIDWSAGNKQKSTLTDDCTFTFTEPSGPCSLILKLVQDGMGNRTVTWPGDVYWPGGTAPTLTTDAEAIDIICFYYDGTDFYGQSALDFSIPA